MLRTNRSRLLGTSLRALVLAGTLFSATPPAMADSYDVTLPETPAQAAQTEHRRHLLLLFPAGVAALTLALILYTRRK